MLQYSPIIGPRGLFFCRPLPGDAWLSLRFSQLRSAAFWPEVPRQVEQDQRFEISAEALGSNALKILFAILYLKLSFKNTNLSNHKAVK